MRLSSMSDSRREESNHHTTWWKINGGHLGMSNRPDSVPVFLSQPAATLAPAPDIIFLRPRNHSVKNGYIFASHFGTCEKKSFIIFWGCLSHRPASNSAPDLSAQHCQPFACLASQPCQFTFFYWSSRLQASSADRTKGLRHRDINFVRNRP